MMMSNDTEIVQFREENYGPYYSNYKRTKPTSFDPKTSTGGINLINFLATFY